MAVEISFHLTGNYPDWWEGKVFRKAPLIWALGINLDSTRKVLQRVLLGTESAKQEDIIGTGTIPRDSIRMDVSERDGHIVRTLKVRHVSGGTSTLEFRSTQQGESALMGATVDYIWLDEEDKHNSMNLYSQCVVRTMTTNGHVVITATPENGETELIRTFQDDGTGSLYLQNATWSDAPHLTPEVKEELLASIPEWQREMRSRGIPVFGQGIIFNLDNSVVECDAVPIDNWDNIIWSIDIGRTNDPTVLTLNVQKETDDGMKYYVAEQYGSSDDRSPEWVAGIIQHHTYCRAPVVIPRWGLCA